MSLTNLGLVEYAKKMVGQPYWYGTCGYECTESLYQRKKKQYPKHYTPSREAKYKKHIKDKMVCSDCVGLIKSYAWTNGGDCILASIGTGFKITSKYKSNDCPDTSADGMFNYAKSKKMEHGKISTIPDIPGIAVRYKGHVGVYIGNGKVVEERGFNYGCVMTELKNRKWTDWYKIPFISYIEEEKKEIENENKDIKKGAVGEKVIEIQKNLIILGYNVGKDGADGDFGPNTESALKTFQKDNKLIENGVYDNITAKKMEELLKEKNNSSISAPITVTNEIIITGGSVNVRSGPSIFYPSIGIVRKGEKYPVINTTGWSPIIYNNEIRWISNKYVSLKDNTYTIIGSSVNVRKGPGTNFPSIAIARKNESYIALENPNNWFCILYKDAINWVSPKYTTISN